MGTIILELDLFVYQGLLLVLNISMNFNAEKTNEPKNQSTYIQLFNLEF